MMIEVNWRATFIDYIKNQVLPPGIKKDDAEAIRIMRHSKNYVLIDEKLYKRGAGSGVLMKYVTAEEGKEILQEAHEGTCGNHATSRTLVGKVFRSGFYWPTALSDAEALSRRCQGCQYFAKQNHLPAHNLITIPPSWQFACWSLDMIGPLPTTPRGFTHILVAVDKFSKWIEVKPITKILSDRAVEFISEILHRFGFPNTIITDLGSNFTSQEFWDYCEDSSNMYQSRIQEPMVK
jgi:hypothetical protein